MQTLKAIISKANSIRFAHVDGLLPSFDNTLSYNESFGIHTTGLYHHTFFVGDNVLVQVKLGSTAVPVMKKVFKDGSEETVSPEIGTGYTDFDIFDYVIPIDEEECYYLSLTTQESTWQSEWISCITDPDNPEYLLVEWTNFDPINDTFEFDYTTTSALAYTNFARVKGQLMGWSPNVESTIFDNQNELTKIKSNTKRVLNLQLETIPRPISEQLTIAMQHDIFQVNNVGYVVEEAPEADQSGAWVDLSADLVLKDSLGFNTNDIGFNCDEIEGDMNIENKVVEDETGNGQFTITAEYGITQIIVYKKSGTPVIKFGTSALGSNILTERTIDDLYINNNGYVPVLGAGWICYYTLSGGTVDIRIQTIKTT